MYIYAAKAAVPARLTRHLRCPAVLAIRLLQKAVKYQTPKNRRFLEKKRNKAADVNLTCKTVGVSFACSDCFFYSSVTSILIQSP